MGISAGGIAILYAALVISFFVLHILGMYPAIAICVLLTVGAFVLVFQGNAFHGNDGDVYKLEFGADLSRAVPVYDIERYKNEILKGPIDRLELGEIVYVKAEQPREKIPYRVIFNIVIIVIGILLEALIILKLKK